MNKLFMVGDMGIAMEMVGWQQGLVKAGEVEGKVRLVMESKEGRELSARVEAHKEGATTACNDGGSSRMAFAQFLADVASLQDRACTGREGISMELVMHDLFYGILPCDLGTGEVYIDE